jgi:DNA-binding YbaB/EbfC family protein
MTTEATTGGGAIKVVIDGKQQIRSITISPDVISDGDVELLQDMITAGVNEAIAKSQEMAAEHLGKLTGGLNIPGLM